MNIEKMAELLVTQAIQVALVGFVVSILFHLFARNRPHLAHALWALVLIKCLMPPIVSSPFGIFQGPSPQEANSTVILAAEPRSSVQEIPERRVVGAPGTAPGFKSTNSIPTGSSPASAERFEESFAHWLSPSVLLLLLWGGGACIAACNITAKLVKFSREIRDQAVTTPDWLGDILAQQSIAVGLRRVPRLVVVGSQVGPAVFGLLNPTIVLPKLLLERERLQGASRGRREVELLISHELVHIRRGDLIWSLVQATAVCCWWFHPAVRLANVMISRESERSCDEETIASLKCSATGYARALLGVMNRRHELTVPLPLPGIRPVDITISRMERIMKLGTGSHKRAPWWVPVIVVVGTMVVLPRGEYAKGQEPQKQLDAREDTTNNKESVSDRTAENGVQPSSTAQWKVFDISRLAAEQPTTYLLGGGDVLGVNVPEILPKKGWERSYPITVMRDGTISLPLLKPISVAGLSTAEVRAQIEDAYEKSNILKSRPRALVSIMELRVQNVLVWRRDLEQGFSPQMLPLRAFESDVLHALSKSGGMPDKLLKSARIVRAKNLKGTDLSRLAERIKRDEVKTQLLIYKQDGRLQLDESVDISLNEGDLLVIDPE